MKNILFALSASLILLLVSTSAVTAQTADKCCENCKGAGSDCCKDASCCSAVSAAVNCMETKCSNGCCNESGSKPDKFKSHKFSDDPKTDNVTGEAVPEGKAIEFSYLGKTYYFSNEANLATFKAEPIDYIKDLMCPIMGDAASKEYSTEYNGTKYYVCCPPCLKKVTKDPAKYLN